MLPHSEFGSFFVDVFCHNLKTDKVNYVKVYNFKKGILHGIYLNR